jgi:hypothetical protein
MPPRRLVAPHDDPAPFAVDSDGRLRQSRMTSSCPATWRGDADQAREDRGAGVAADRARPIPGRRESATRSGRPSLAVVDLSRQAGDPSRAAGYEAAASSPTATITSDALTIAITSLPYSIPSSRTASSVIEARSRWPLAFM